MSSSSTSGLFSGYDFLSVSALFSTVEGISEHYEIIMEFERRYQEDCIVFFKEYEKLNDISLKAFTYFYIKYTFPSLTTKDRWHVDGVPFYTDSCFAVIRKFLKYADKVIIKVGAIYLLNAIYSQQTDDENLAHITITLPEFKNLAQLAKDLKEKNMIDVFFIYNKLMFEDAFCFSATERTMGVDLLNYWQPIELENDIFKLPSSGIKSSLTSSFASISDAGNANEVCLDYDRALKEYEETTNTTVRMKIESTVINESERLLEEIKQLVDDLDENSSQESDYKSNGTTFEVINDNTMNEN